MKMTNVLLLLLMISTLFGCGSPRGGNGAGGNGGGGTPPVVGASTLTITMPSTTLAARAAITVSAKLLDGTGTPVANECVTFSTNRTSDTLATNLLVSCQNIVGGNFPGVVKTNTLGIATTTLTTGIDGGPGILTVTAGAASAFVNYTVNTGTVTLVLTDIGTGATVNNVVIGSPIKVTATVIDGGNVVVPNAIVTFSTGALGTIIPASATALTDAAGQASVNLDGVAIGADTVTASVQLGVSALTGSAVYSVGTAVLSMPNAMRFGVGVNPLSANGTTSVMVDVFSGGLPVTTPVAVSFSSNCSLAGTATISTPVTTVNGIATATYTDQGCGAVDTITASVAGVSLTGTLTITPPTSGSIQFVSAVPTLITLKGTGGQGRQETSIVTFKVLDTGSNPLAGKVVNFALSTTVGGITLSQTSGTSDALGLVTTTVSSGTVSTPVRVIATTLGALATPLQTLSDVLTITTGIPDQDSVSLSATKLNIEGLSVDGITSILTMRLSDHFNNPVPDGTAVNFITEGGQIVGSCTTTLGACSSTLTSANPRPASGRVTVLAFAVGEESFSDLNSNGFADPGEMKDLNGFSTDLAEAFLDSNENAVHDAGEFFLDFRLDPPLPPPFFTLADGEYSGVLCNPALRTTPPIPPFCAPTQTVHVRGSVVIVFSSGAAFTPIPIAITTVPVNPLGLDLGGATAAPVIASDCNTPASVTFTVKDVNGNALPVGTTISFATSNGTITGTSSFIVPNTNANVTTSPTAFDYTVSLKSDATFTAAVAGPPAVAAFCTDTTPSGTLTATVISPLGIVSTGSVAVNN